MPCLANGTIIETWCQQAMNVASLRSGSRVTCFATDGRALSTRVISNASFTSRAVVEVNDELTVSFAHPLYSIEKGWIAASEIQFGDILLGVSGVTEVLSIRFRETKTLVFDLVLDGVFVANGYFTTSKRLGIDQRRAFGMNRIAAAALSMNRTSGRRREFVPASNLESNDHWNTGNRR